MRHLSCDNRYACPELAMAAREKFNCHASGTARKIRKGWDKDLMNLDTKSDRGTCKPAYDKENEILIGQWNDDKVVNFHSSVNEIGLGNLTNFCPTSDQLLTNF